MDFIHVHVHVHHSKCVGNFITNLLRMFQLDLSGCMLALLNKKVVTYMYSNDLGRQLPL